MTSPYLASELSLLGTVVPTALGVAMGDRGGSLRGWLIAYGVFVGPSIVGLGAYVASALYDIARAGAAAEAWNARHAERRVTVMPQVDPVTRSGGVSVRIGV